MRNRNVHLSLLFVTVLFFYFLDLTPDEIEHTVMIMTFKWRYSVCEISKVCWQVKYRNKNYFWYIELIHRLLYSVKVLIISGFNFWRRIKITGNLRLLIWHIFTISFSVSLRYADTFHYYCGYFNIYISIWYLVSIDYSRQSVDPLWLVQLYVLPQIYSKPHTFVLVTMLEKVWDTLFLELCVEIFSVNHKRIQRQY